MIKKSFTIFQRKNGPNNNDSAWEHLGIPMYTSMDYILLLPVSVLVSETKVSKIKSLT